MNRAVVVRAMTCALDVPFHVFTASGVVSAVEVGILHLVDQKKSGMHDKLVREN